jgi:Xaa-Pro aminopeptidase
VDAILDDDARRAEHASRVAWDRVDQWRSVGGVRIEDDVLVTRDGPHILTAEIAK